MKQRFNLGRLNTFEVLLITHTILFSSNIIGRGLFWFVRQDTVLNDSPLYGKLHEVMPIWVWGLILMITGLIYLTSAFHITSMKENNRYYWLSFIGAGSSAIFYFIMLSASIYNNINWLSPYNFLITSVWTTIVAFVGGAELYGKRK
ncbi:hypothetical protein PZN53_09955 [Staphylococcus pettenkoferi]|uniref:hypothetical protein n=1 Tax=Staphylococcus pettenkoferi TaxID=170573 RepID=UPI00247FE1B1|nr:hypothetical protein [Staphylococcus pettenkoferi]MDH9616852.1 hypothetical protein [Staphylococcus pettenkoferi]